MKEKMLSTEEKKATKKNERKQFKIKWNAKSINSIGSTLDSSVCWMDVAEDCMAADDFVDG